MLNEEKLDTERNTEAKKNIEVLTLSASSLSLDENDMSGSEAKNGMLGKINVIFVILISCLGGIDTNISKILIFVCIPRCNIPKIDFFRSLKFQHKHLKILFN